jgi:hypothetical protein
MTTWSRIRRRGSELVGGSAGSGVLPVLVRVSIGLVCVGLVLAGCTAGGDEGGAPAARTSPPSPSPSPSPSLPEAVASTGSPVDVCLS